MAAGLTTFTALVNGAARAFNAGADAGGNLSPGHTLLDQFGNPLGSTANPVVVADANGAAFQGSSVITPGTAITPGRSVAYVCTAAGNITITLPDASTMTFGIAASPDLQTLPFAVTLLTLGSGTAGTFWTVR